jgi:hypothetical protein
VLERAARSDNAWSPKSLDEEELAEALAFVANAVRSGEAEPADMDALLRRASSAFLARDEATAFRLFDALLPPLADGSIYLGQDELIDEVLGIDLRTCTTQYLVSAYLLASADKRAQPLSAPDRDERLRHSTNPLRRRGERDVPEQFSPVTLLGLQLPRRHPRNRRKWLWLRTSVSAGMPRTPRTRPR